MAAEKGNKYAEKVTLKDAHELVDLAFSKITPNCFFLSTLAVECDTYREKFAYVLKKFNDDEHVFRTIKKIYSKCESIVMEKTANGDIVPSLGIFVLKAYHGLMESSKQTIEQTNINTNPISKDELDQYRNDLENEI